MVVAGHGAPQQSEAALEILDADVAYLEALLESGSAAALPDGRTTGAQRKIHAQNVARVVG